MSDIIYYYSDQGVPKEIKVGEVIEFDIQIELDPIEPPPPRSPEELDEDLQSGFCRICEHPYMIDPTPYGSDRWYLWCKCIPKRKRHTDYCETDQEWLKYHCPDLYKLTTVTNPINS